LIQQSKDILQINVTIIEGGFIFLTFISFAEINKNITLTILPLTAVIWFSLLSFLCIVVKKSSEKDTMGREFKLLSYYHFSFQAAFIARTTEFLRKSLTTAHINQIICVCLLLNWCSNQAIELYFQIHLISLLQAQNDFHQFLFL
jgi:hypothetical protein